MTMEEILSGESSCLEFKREVPKKSETYIKTVIAFANGSGGRIIFGVEDNPPAVIGINQEDAFSLMDGNSAPEEAVGKEEIDFLCDRMYQYAVSHCKSKEAAERIHRLTEYNLLSWGFLEKRKEVYFPTNAFVLMRHNSFPQATIQCAVFKGKDRGVFIDRREYDGDLVTQLDEAYQYVLRNINMSSEIDGLHRTDVYELPTDCIREMICNAVVHRSYLHPSSIQVAVYDDRVEVTSPGMLFGSLSLEDIKAGISIPRNRALVYAFTYMNIMEHWGEWNTKNYQAM